MQPCAIIFLRVSVKFPPFTSILLFSDFTAVSGPEPSFTYAVGERLTYASLPTAGCSTEILRESFSEQPWTSSDAYFKRYAWLRPGVRRFLLAVSPLCKLVLLVRRRCSRRRCYCDGDAPRSAGAGSIPCNTIFSGPCALSKSNSTACAISRVSDGGGSGVLGARELEEWQHRGCGAALFAAALPQIDPDGQFFGHRYV